MTAYRITYTLADMMTEHERRVYEGTGHGGSLESRLLAFRQAMRIMFRCAWCQPVEAPTAHVVYSHGICADCKARIEREG